MSYLPRKRKVQGVRRVQRLGHQGRDDGCLPSVWRQGDTSRPKGARIMRTGMNSTITFAPFPRPAAPVVWKSDWRKEQERRREEDRATQALQSRPDSGRPPLTPTPAPESVEPEREREVTRKPDSPSDPQAEADRAAPEDVWICREVRTEAQRSQSQRSLQVALCSDAGER